MASGFPCECGKVFRLNDLLQGGKLIVKSKLADGGQDKSSSHLTKWPYHTYIFYSLAGAICYDGTAEYGGRQNTLPEISQLQPPSDEQRDSDTQEVERSQRCSPLALRFYPARPRVHRHGYRQNPYNYKYTQSQIAPADKVRQGMFITAAMVGILKEIHAKGIIHRDLEPGNVGLCAGKVCIFDFGMSTLHNRVLLHGGTLGHMSISQQMQSEPTK